MHVIFIFRNHIRYWYCLKDLFDVKHNGKHDSKFDIRFKIYHFLVYASKTVTCEGWGREVDCGYILTKCRDMNAKLAKKDGVW